MKINVFGPATSQLEDLLEWVLLWAGVVFLVLGVAGALIMLSGYNIIRDRVLQFVFTFVSFYMMALGLFLVFYHKKLVVRPKV